MTGFLFSRRPASSAPEPKVIATPSDELTSALHAQAMTTSAIFAMLVSKGILSAAEASEYMREIGAVLERDVNGRVGKVAGRFIESYGSALGVAGP